jgi:hypothetical protein
MNDISSFEKEGSGSDLRYEIICSRNLTRIRVAAFTAKANLNWEDTDKLLKTLRDKITFEYEDREGPEIHILDPERNRGRLCVGFEAMVFAKPEIIKKKLEEEGFQNEEIACLWLLKQDKAQDSIY